MTFNFKECYNESIFTLEVVFVVNDKELFQKGLKDGIAIGLSYIPAAMAISIAASRQNLPFGIWELMSALLYSSSAQAAILNLLSNGATAFLIYILTFSIMKILGFKASTIAKNSLNK